MKAVWEILRLSVIQQATIDMSIIIMCHKREMINIYVSLNAVFCLFYHWSIIMTERQMDGRSQPTHFIKADN